MNKQIKKIRNSKGFTLIELMIVVAIIGILAAVAIPQYQTYTLRSTATSQVTAAMRPVQNAIAEFAAMNGELPDTGFADLATAGLTDAAGAPIGGSTDLATGLIAGVSYTRTANGAPAAISTGYIELTFQTLANKAPDALDTETLRVLVHRNIAGVVTFYTDATDKGSIQANYLPKIGKTPI